MDIIIVGCGKVGIALAEVLSEEHNVTMIDKDENLINAAINDFDIMGIAGNCLQTNVLEEANVDKANLFIAVTHVVTRSITCCKSKSECVCTVFSNNFKRVDTVAK